MPSFNPNPFASGPVQLMSGVTEYPLGRKNAYQADTRIQITGVVDNGTTAVFSGQILEGNIPTVGSLFSAYTSNATYNAVNRQISAINFTANGFGTVTVPSMAAGTSAITGNGLIPVPEIPETIVAGASIPCIVPLHEPSAISRKIFAEVTFPAIPTAATVSLQAAMRNVDSEYVTVAPVGTVSGGAVTLSQAYFEGQALYYRLFTSGVTGTGTVVGKVIV